MPPRGRRPGPSGTRERILDAARELFAAQGFERTTMRGVAARADPVGLLDTLTAEGDPALFLRGDVYGTRASTLVAVAADGHARIVERRYGTGGRPAGTTTLEFSLAD